MPALLVGKLDVDEIKTMEGVLALDATEEVGAALLAGVALDNGGGIDAKS